MCQENDRSDLSMIANMRHFCHLMVRLRAIFDKLDNNPVDVWNRIGF